MLGQQVSSDLLLPDVRAHGDEDGKAASYEREGQGRRRGSKPTGEPQGGPRRARPYRAIERGDEL